MNRLQQWFEHIAGLTLEERQRWALAQEIYGKQSVDTQALEMPACWRRNAARRTLKV